MPKYSNSNNTNLSLQYCFSELQKINPNITKSDFAAFINVSRQNIGQRINRNSKLTTREKNYLKEKLQENGIPTKFLNIAVLSDSIVQVPVRSEVELSCGYGSTSNADFISDTIGLDINFIKSYLAADTL